jgi:hypothetical protein
MGYQEITNEVECAASCALIFAQALPDFRGVRNLEEIFRVRPRARPNRRILEFGSWAGAVSR